VAIVRAISTLAQQIGITVVAEGVENAAQVHVLRQWGIDRGQGFLFAPALDAAQMRARLTD
jgi:EAL domain-containing protein (putative c-di-GMP-specific phosphodiesterase class I)